MLQTIFLILSATAWFVASAAQVRAFSDRPVGDPEAFTRRNARLNAVAALFAGLAAIMTLAEI